MAVGYKYKNDTIEKQLKKNNNLSYPSTQSVWPLLLPARLAREVRLAQGSQRNDLENYGLKIDGKSHKQEPLQELTPNHHSGGERSVATAIYMLALQASITVPFRYEDEINQGMNASNKQLVFDLLVNTSCRESCH